MESQQFGNLPGRRVFWASADGRTEIIRYYDGVFGLEYDGREVMPEASFERINAYAWAEFISL